MAAPLPFQFIRSNGRGIDKPLMKMNLICRHVSNIWSLKAGGNWKETFLRIKFQMCLLTLRRGGLKLHYLLKIVLKTFKFSTFLQFCCQIQNVLKMLRFFKEQTERSKISKSERFCQIIANIWDHVGASLKLISFSSRTHRIIMRG